MAHLSPPADYDKASDGLLSVSIVEEEAFQERSNSLKYLEIITGK